ncbi:hypothetical protein [Salmonirosea aquatica]|uniref:hypothetical protein n=1 Tax=Salmonirosea aquatica TaxID=2654236 RepID=UPI0035714C91
MSTAYQGRNYPFFRPFLGGFILLCKQNPYGDRNTSNPRKGKKERYKKQKEEKTELAR